MAALDIDLLLVDSDEERLERLKKKLGSYLEFNVHSAAGLDDAKQALDRYDVDCVVSEQTLSDGTAIDVFQYAYEKKPEIGRIILTAEDEAEVHLDELELIYRYVDRTQENAEKTLANLIIDSYQNNAFAPYLTPPDEQERLETIEEYDFQRSKALEDLTELAAKIFDVDKVSINIVGREKQYVVVSRGFDGVTDAEMERRKTICTHAILQEDVFVIGNVRDYPRFKNIDFYHDHDINWYAGATITINNASVGTFCLLDDEQHDFSDRDHEMLELLAQQAATLIELENRLKGHEQPDELV